MAKQTINVGSGDQSGDGESIRSAFVKINENFDEIYNLSETTIDLTENYNNEVNTRIDELQIPTDISDLTDSQGLLEPDLTGYATVDQIPTDISDLTDTEGLLNQGGGGAGPIQPYLELTNNPIITLPPTLGNPVTVTAAGQGFNAQFTVVIGEGPTIDSIVVTSPGNGYVAGQRYRIWSYYIGGPNDNSSIDFTVETVGDLGEILTISNAAFVGVASNTPGTYTNASIQYRPYVFDEIGPGLILTRGIQQGIYNSASEQEYDNNSYVSPLGTEWNSDGWADLSNIKTRSYSNWRSALNNQVGNNIIGSELVMHDTINDKYYKFDFTQWGGNNGGYSYTRTEITDLNYFQKIDYGNEIDVIVEDDSAGAGIGITRGNNNSIYNPYREQGYNEEISPAGTLWNIDGYDDLSNITTRTYLPFYAAYNGNLGNRVPGSKSIMYVPDTGKYYAVEWTSWTQGGNGGGFSYIRREIDITKVNEGVKFSDGTVLKTATGIGRVKSTASGNRRIEEVSGSKTISVTERITQPVVQGTSFDSRFDYYIYLVWDQDLYNLYDGPTDFELEISLDDSTWYPARVVGSSTNNWLQIYLVGDRSVTINTNDPIYYRVSTGAEPVVWWDKADLPGGAADFRGAVIDYHAYSGEATWIGTIHIVDDDGEEHISHTEVSSGSTDAENDDLWLVQNEGTISYRRIDGEAKTLKVHWTAKVFYGSEYWD